MFYIYGLRLKGEREYRYVGSTVDMEKRLWAHFGDADRLPDQANPELRQWLRDNGRNGVAMDMLQEVEEERDKRPTEQRWIIKLTKDGHRLFNIRAADGIEGTLAGLPAEQRKKIVTRYLDDFERDTDEPWFKEEGPVYHA